MLGVQKYSQQNKILTRMTQFGSHSEYGTLQEVIVGSAQDLTLPPFGKDLSHYNDELRSVPTPRPHLLRRHSRTPPLSFPQSLSGNPYWIMPTLIRLTQTGFPLIKPAPAGCKQGTPGMTRTRVAGLRDVARRPNLGICTPSPIIINTCCSATCRFQLQQVQQQQQGQLAGRLQHQNTHHSLSLRSRYNMSFTSNKTGFPLKDCGNDGGGECGNDDGGVRE